MKIKLHKDAKKHLLRLSDKNRDRILKAINKLPEGDVVPLKSRYPLLRLRIGDYRIIFEYIGDDIYVQQIGSRGDIY